MVNQLAVNCKLQIKFTVLYTVCVLMFIKALHQQRSNINFLYEKLHPKTWTPNNHWNTMTDHLRGMELQQGKG